MFSYWREEIWPIQLAVARRCWCSAEKWNYIKMTRKRLLCLRTLTTFFSMPTRRKFSNSFFNSTLGFFFLLKDSAGRIQLLLPSKLTAFLIFQFISKRVTKHCFVDCFVRYPEVERGKRFLNSGLFMGYAPELHQILNSGEIANDDDDQLFYTKVFLDEKKRQELNIKLDHRSEIFQNLNGAVSDVELRFIGTSPFVIVLKVEKWFSTQFIGTESHLQNTVYNTVPLVIHANGPTKLFLNTLGNYLPKSWNSEEGCLNCWEDMNSLEKKKVGNHFKTIARPRNIINFKKKLCSQRTSQKW